MPASPVRNVLLNKAAIIERCIRRAREEYAGGGAEFENNYSRQDAAVINVIRACEACIDIGQVIIRAENLGLNKSAGEIFEILAHAKIIPASLSKAMKSMVGFRNIAVHQYQELDFDKLVLVLSNRLDDLLDFVRIILQREA